MYTTLLCEIRSIFRITVEWREWEPSESERVALKGHASFYAPRITRWGASKLPGRKTNNFDLFKVQEIMYARHSAPLTVKNRCPTSSRDHPRRISRSYSWYRGTFDAQPITSMKRVLDSPDLKQQPPSFPHTWSTSQQRHLLHENTKPQSYEIELLWDEDSHAILIRVAAPADSNPFHC